MRSRKTMHVNDFVTLKDVLQGWKSGPSLDARPAIQTANAHSYDGEFPPFVCMLAGLGLTRLLG
jgi:hypothetical protein